jgi:hypothetical protein
MKISIELTDEILSDQMSMDVVTRSQRAKEMMQNVEIGCNEMSEKTSFRSEMSSTKSKQTTPLNSTIHSTVNTARRDIITGIITIPASSLSSQNILLAHENMICDLFDDPTSADCSPRSSFSAKESPKRPTALPAHLYAINDENSDHECDGVSKNLDDEGDYFVGGDANNPIFI